MAQFTVKILIDQVREEMCTLRTQRNTLIDHGNYTKAGGLTKEIIRLQDFLIFLEERMARKIPN